MGPTPLRTKKLTKDDNSDGFLPDIGVSISISESIFETVITSFTTGDHSRHESATTTASPTSSSSRSTSVILSQTSTSISSTSLVSSSLSSPISVSTPRTIVNGGSTTSISSSVEHSTLSATTKSATITVSFTDGIQTQLATSTVSSTKPFFSDTAAVVGVSVAGGLLSAALVVAGCVLALRRRTRNRKMYSKTTKSLWGGRTAESSVSPFQAGEDDPELLEAAVLFGGRRGDCFYASRLSVDSPCSPPDYTESPPPTYWARSEASASNAAATSPSISSDGSEAQQPSRAQCHFPGPQKLRI